MPKTHAIQTFTVSGVLPFPLDMLRYDNAWPASTDDASAILDSIERAGDVRRYVVKLHRAVEYQHIPPTAGRWSSFGWKVEP